LIEQQKNIRKHKILLLTSHACKRGISIEALTSLNSGRWLGSSCQQSCSNLASLSGTCEGISGRRPLIEEWYPLVRNIYSDKYKKISLKRNFQILHASSPCQSKLQLQTFQKSQASSTYAYTPHRVGARFIKAQCFLEWLDDMVLTPILICSIRTYERIWYILYCLRTCLARLYLCTTPMAACKGVILPYGTCPVNTSLQTMSNSISLMHRVEWILSLNKELNLRVCTVTRWLESVAAASWPNQNWHGMKHSLQTHKTSQASCWLGRHICLRNHTTLWCQKSIHLLCGHKACAAKPIISHDNPGQRFNGSSNLKE